jgi:adenylate cyclase
LTTGSKKKIRIQILLVIGSFLVTHLCFALLPSVFEIWNSQAVDQLFTFRASSDKYRLPYDRTVAYVDFNNTSIQQLNHLFLDRSHYAQAIRNLTSMGVAAQLFDYIFAGRLTKGDDDAFIRETKASGNTYFGVAFELREDHQPQPKQQIPSKTQSYLDQTKWHVKVAGNTDALYVGENPLITFYDLATASRGLGSLSVKFDPDGVLRRVPLLVRYQEAYYPLLPLRAACHYLNVTPEKILLHPGKHIILRDAKKPGDEAPHDIVIPIDQKGNMIINFVGPWGSMDHYSFADIYMASDDRDDLEMWGEELEGKIIIISDVSTGSSDVGPVPTDANFPLSGAHANIIHSILTESFLRELTGWEMLMVEVLLMTALLVLSVRFSSLYFSLGTVLVAAAFIAVVGAGFFYRNVIFHIGRPLLMITLAMISINVYRYINEEKEKMESFRQRDFIRDTFGRYMSGEVVEELLDSPEGLKMSGEIREVTFLVSDLRGFTALTSRLSPHEIIEVINRYFEHMVDVISEYRGVVNEFLGDGILVFFGAPLQEKDDRERAVACAIEMQNAMVKVNEEQRRLNLPELAMGIGINTGDVVVGNIGSERRAAYGAVGSAINIAYRIESYTIGGQILISPSAYEKIRSIVRIKDTKQVQFKGIDHPVDIYDVVALEGSYQVKVPEKKKEKFSELNPPLPIDCYLLEEKTISDTAIAGRIIQLGETVAEAVLKETVEAHANLRILMAPGENSSLAEVYAKVLPADEHDPKASQNSILLQFTWLPEEVKEFLAARRSANNQ